MNIKVKEFIKENLLLMLVFFFAVFGLGGYKLYNSIRNKVVEHTPYESTDMFSSESYYEQKDYGVNEYKIITKSDQDLVDYYYKKIKNMWINDPGKIYDLMTDSAKKYNGSREAFAKDISKYITSNTASSTVAYYSVIDAKIVILTSENMQIIINQKGINDYKIDLMAQASN